MNNLLNEIADELKILENLQIFDRFQQFFKNGQTRILIPYKQEIPDEANDWFRAIQSDGWSFSKIPNIMEKEEKKEFNGKIFLDKKKVKIGSLLKKYGGDKAEIWWNINSKSYPFSSEDEFSIIFSINPVDILRTGDVGKYKAKDGQTEWQSCLSPDGHYFGTLKNEASFGGGVCFLVKTEDLNKINLQDDDIFEDNDRPRYNHEVKGLEVFNRIRVRRAVNPDEAIELAIPEERIYGPNNSFFYDSILDFFISSQDDKIKLYNYAKSSEWQLYGGEYEDTPLSDLLKNLGIFGYQRYKIIKSVKTRKDILDEEFSIIWDKYCRPYSKASFITKDDECEIRVERGESSEENGKWKIELYADVWFSFYGYSLVKKYFEKGNIYTIFDLPLIRDFGFDFQLRDLRDLTTVSGDSYGSDCGAFYHNFTMKFSHPDKVEEFLSNLREFTENFNSAKFYTQIREYNRKIFDAPFEERSDLIEKVDYDRNGRLELSIKKSAYQHIPIYNEYDEWYSSKQYDERSEISAHLIDEIYDFYGEKYGRILSSPVFSFQVGISSFILWAIVVNPLQPFYIEGHSSSGHEMLDTKSIIAAIEDGITNQIPIFLKNTMNSYDKKIISEEQKVLDTFNFFTSSSSNNSFKDIFNGQKRIVIPLTLGESSEERSLLEIINKLSRLGYYVPINGDDFGYAFKNEQKEHDGKSFYQRKRYKIGTILQKEKSEFSDWDQVWWSRESYKFIRNKENLFKSNKFSIVISCVPLDVVRMSDHREWTSCHSPGRKNDRGHFNSAVEAAYKDECIAYLVETESLNKFEKNLEENDFFQDLDRSVNGPVPQARIRIRPFKINNVKFLIPEDNIYKKSSKHFSSFKENLFSFIAEAQREKIVNLLPFINHKAKNGQDISVSMYGSYYYEEDSAKDVENFFQHFGVDTSYFNFYIIKTGDDEQWDEDIEGAFGPDLEEKFDEAVEEILRYIRRINADRNGFFEFLPSYSIEHDGDRENVLSYLEISFFIPKTRSVESFLKLIEQEQFTYENLFDEDDYSNTFNSFFKDDLIKFHMELVDLFKNNGKNFIFNHIESFLINNSKKQNKLKVHFVIEFEISNDEDHFYNESRRIIDFIQTSDYKKIYLKMLNLLSNISGDDLLSVYEYNSESENLLLSNTLQNSNLVSREDATIRFNPFAPLKGLSFRQFFDLDLLEHITIQKYNLIRDQSQPSLPGVSIPNHPLFSFGRYRTVRDVLRALRKFLIASFLIGPYSSEGIEFSRINNIVYADIESFLILQETISLIICRAWNDGIEDSIGEKDDFEETKQQYLLPLSEQQLSLPLRYKIPDHVAKTMFKIRFCEVYPEEKNDLENLYFYLSFEADRGDNITSMSRLHQELVVFADLHYSDIIKVISKHMIQSIKNSISNIDEIENEWINFLDTKTKISSTFLF